MNRLFFTPVARFSLLCLDLAFCPPSFLFSRRGDVLRDGHADNATASFHQPALPELPFITLQSVVRPAQCLSFNSDVVIS